MVSATNDVNHIGFHNVKGLKGKKHITIRVSAQGPNDSEIVVRKGSATGPVITRFAIKPHQSDVFTDFTAELPELEDKENLYFSISPSEGQGVNLDYFLIY